jgi:3-isopropylmalate dehydratase small subunit
MRMEKIKGRAYPLGLANVDTDMIVSAEWLKTISRQGLGRAAFERLRSTPGNPFEDPRYKGSPILIAGDNFGCGSSREHAAWALKDMGIDAIVAPSFSDIFASNAFKNGIATVALPEIEVERLLASAIAGEEMEISLVDQRVTDSSGEHFDFPMDPFRKMCLVEGLDEVALTLASEPQIETYEIKLQRERPWLLPRAAA